ncbi:hypothetical protein RHMOL_Rhmol13G0212700 [Rhododendron molle]|uniref:Uncharacterized protein n=1 Tax=Rhododendron molle TaxID=49168 RepID=A0ACC0LA68_RHOML|nr:hypothetical protein RHMOL_Rhmol13G0212700 [Rhododendron molle]
MEDYEEAVKDEQREGLCEGACLLCNCLLPAGLNETKVRHVRPEDRAFEKKKLRSQSSRFPSSSNAHPSLSSGPSSSSTRVFDCGHLNFLPVFYWPAVENSYRYGRTSKKRSKEDMLCFCRFLPSTDHVLQSPPLPPLTTANNHQLPPLSAPTASVATANHQRNLGHSVYCSAFWCSII